jgi:hypothetical protein
VEISAENDNVNNDPKENDAEVMMDVGGAKKIKVTKAKMNALIFKDLFVEGKKKMISMNIPEIRFEQKCRQRREQVGLHTDLYTFMKSMGDNNASVPNQIKKA